MLYLDNISLRIKTSNLASDDGNNSKRVNKKINEENINLTEGEIKEKFKISFVDRNTLFKMLLEDHSSAMDGKIFDEENQIVINNI